MYKCKVCGGVPDMLYHDSIENGVMRCLYMVECPLCGNRSREKPTIATAKEAWNEENRKDDE